MMKKTLLSFLFFLFICPDSHSQVYGTEYGDVTYDELSMTSYDRDSTAHAVFIYEKVNRFYRVTDKIQLIREYSAKIKILDSDGTSWADVEIPFYVDTRSGEKVSDIMASAYNMEHDGRIIKTDLAKQMIFRERVNDKVSVMKFSIPDVRAGTVVEFRYTVYSDYILYIPDIPLQHSIPVIYGTARFTIPQWFGYKMHIRGFNEIPFTQNKIQESTVFPGRGEIKYTSDVIELKTEHIPALKEESYVWNHKDFRSRAEFEISEYLFPFQPHNKRSQTWAAVNQTLRRSDFGKYLKMQCPFKEDLAKIKFLHDDPVVLARQVKNYVQSKVKWDGDYRLLGENPRDAFRLGSGSSAAINFLIISGLKECGIDAVPVLLNPRSYGRILLTWPTIDNINAFVIMFETSDGTYFLDGTDILSDINVLPANLMVDMARVYGADKESDWIDLTGISRNSTRHNISAKVGPDGTVGIEHYTYMHNVPSMLFNREFSKAGSEEKYREDIEEEQGISIDSLEIKGAGTSSVTQVLRYMSSCERSGEDMMLKGVVMDFMENNIFTDQQRMLPIEFDFPYYLEITCSIELPEGYTVSHVPGNVAMSVCEEGAVFRYLTHLTDNLMVVRMTLKVDRILYSAMEYDDLKMFFGLISDKCSSRITISPKGNIDEQGL